jgi:hypothetical protein
MAVDLLVNQGASITGTWSRVEPPAKKTGPSRLIVTGTFVGDVVHIEELVGGHPGKGFPANVANSPFIPQADTGTVVLVQDVAGPQDVVIDAPIEYIRARTGAFTGGTTASVRFVPAA